MAITIAYTAIVSFILLKVIDVVIGLRVSDEAERDGLDLVDARRGGAVSVLSPRRELQRAATGPPVFFCCAWFSQKPGGRNRPRAWSLSGQAKIAGWRARPSNGLNGKGTATMKATTIGLIAALGVAAAGCEGMSDTQKRTSDGRRCRRRCRCFDRWRDGRQRPRRRGAGRCGRRGRGLPLRPRQEGQGPLLSGSAHRYKRGACVGRPFSLSGVRFGFVLLLFRFSHDSAIL